ncbi:Transcription factor, myb superfamily, partial [Globisporangium splendens]
MQANGVDAGASSSLAAVSASHVSELGKALDQTTISSASVAGSLTDASQACDDEDDDEGDEDDADEGDEEDDYEEDEYAAGEYGAHEDDDDDGAGTEDGDDFGMAGPNDDDSDDNAAASALQDGSLSTATTSANAGAAAPAPLKNLPTKSQKRGRTDSLKKMLPAPASQRHKQKNGDDLSGECTIEDALISGVAPKPQPTKLLVKDRTGAGMGVPRPHLIINAVKQAPPAKEKSNPRRWSKHEDESLRLAVERSGERNWKAIADQVPGRNHTQCLQRWTKVLKPGLIKGHWTPEEDTKLRELVTEEKKNWGQVASLIPGRTSYTEDEDKIIIEMQAKLGNRWSIIAQQLKGRTEDAVKIRWKSLMRGRRAAMKDEKSHSGAPTSSNSSSIASSPAKESPSSGFSSEKPKPKATKSTPARQKTRAASPVVKLENDAVGSASVDHQAMNVTSAAASMVPAPVDLEPADLPSVGSSLSAVDGLDPAELAAAMSSIQSVNDDLVATSIHNFQMSQRFHQQSNGAGGNLAANAGGGVFAANAQNVSQTISPVNHAMYSASSNGYNANINLSAQPNSFHVQQQQQQGFNPMQSTSPAMGQNYGFGVASQMTMSQQQMQFYNGLPNGMNAVPQGFNHQQGFAPPQRGSMYQAQNAAGMGYGFAPQTGAQLPNQNFNNAAMQANMYANFALNTPSSAAPGGLPPTSNGMNIGLPPSSAAAAAKMLNTPREEWGSSQTPRSQMILTEGHASAYELFHQQRVRLMLQEREKHGLTLSSAPSPGQAMLTKELEANKERQKRQAIMQKGWKSAVEAMTAYNSDLSALDDGQGFDGFLEKVALSGLDPTDEELIGDIMAGGMSVGHD